MKISLIVPVYNEEKAIPIFYESVRNAEFLKNFTIEIVFINDGSSDLTEELINSLSLSDPLVTSLNFTRNFGKEPALFAGLENATGEAIIPIDVDLQDPIEVIPELIRKWQDGYDIVLAKRVDRTTDTILKRESAKLFYALHNKISKPKIEENVGDFRLMSREVVENIKKLPERNIFMKGLFSWVGGNTTIVEYKRAERSAGNTKFNGWRLWNLALEGITSFSTVPLKIWTYLGLFVSGFSFFYGMYLILDKLLFDNPVPGYTSLLVSVLFIGGVQLIGIGVLGEYIGRIYMETKQRPKFILKKNKNIK
ncbi:glycosyltransferase family 2 protein [Escherichia coli]|uniref:glycosyltransferase family 2 protein n=1 Tax=Escherichia coli TaxID=562 RepID=UPI000CF0CDFA|nr:glycosyltransferase family 2 protein [Escherichia coli]MBE9705260.1 glycosyltransferase [Escherichia coli]MCA7593698.1 glycosyltransferase family 2 protein [Escherichia coli]PPV95957.1 glycosyltransferase [Escherichia coli]PPW91524.1 glycosyltransferase [Escherichia coli]HAV2144056.1 glycosyltransferase family 2 protein [Escherichia coli]